MYTSHGRGCVFGVRVFGLCLADGATLSLSVIPAPATRYNGASSLPIEHSASSDANA